ncbi:MAG: DNA replication protein [Acidobacteria bacterium]|nr:DNA replication protein [Acidobacteriota bacterium]
MRRCIASDWLRKEGEELKLSDAGDAYLRRAASQSDPFRQQHQLPVTAERKIGGVCKTVALNAGESPLGWLRNRKDRKGQPLLTSEQYEAGERLRSDYDFAHLAARVTSDWSGLAPSSRSRRSAAAADIRDEVIAAKARVVKALETVGPELGGILVDICCELKGLEEAEKAHGWPQRAGKTVLQLALTRLARHYGLLRAEAPGGRRQILRHWGSEDYRPSIDGWKTRPDQ